MEWNVYIHNINSRKIEIFNIFRHGRFTEDVRKAAKKYKRKNEFAEQLKNELRYYFWAKCEWETIIGPWIGNTAKISKKIDVYGQVMLNWDVFVDYVWNNRKELLNEEKR